MELQTASDSNSGLQFSRNAPTPELIPVSVDVTLITSKVGLTATSGFGLIVSYFCLLGSKGKAGEGRGQQSVPHSGIYMHNSALMIC